MDPPQSDVFLLYILSKETQRKARFKTRIYSVSTVILYFCGLSFGYENTLGMCYEILYPDISVSVQNPAWNGRHFQMYEIVLLASNVIIDFSVYCQISALLSAGTGQRYFMEVSSAYFQYNHFTYQIL